MAVRAYEKRLYVERQYALVPGTYANLLLALQTAAFQVADAGKVGTPSAVTVADRSTAFSNSDHGSTPSDMADMWGELLDLYDVCRAALVLAGFASPSDAQIKTEMVFRLKPVKEFSNTYAGLQPA